MSWDMLLSLEVLTRRGTVAFVGATMFSMPWTGTYLPLTVTAMIASEESVYIVIKIARAARIAVAAVVSVLGQDRSRIRYATRRSGLG